MSSEDLKCCKICNKTFGTVRGHTTHVFLEHKLNKKEYFDKFFKIQTPTCECCGVEVTRFHTFEKGYRKTCSNHCACVLAGLNQWKNAEERRKNNSIRFKENNPSVGRPKGAKGKNPYPKVSRNFSEKTLKAMSERFTKMNNERTAEDYYNLFKNRKFTPSTKKVIVTKKQMIKMDRSLAQILDLNESPEHVFDGVENHE